MESLRRTLLRVLVASLVATALLAVTTLLAGDFADTDAQILLTTLAISGYSLLSLPAGVLLDRGERRMLAAAVLAATSAGFLLALVLVWTAWGDPAHALMKTWGCVTVAAAALAQIAGVASRMRAGDSRSTTRVAVASAVTGLTLGALGVVAIVGEVDDEWYYRAVASLAVVNVTLLVLQPFLRRMTDAGTGTTRLVIELPNEQADVVADELRGRGFRVEPR